MTRPHRDVAEAAGVQQISDRALGHDHAEASLDRPLEIDTAPAHHPVRRHVWTRLDDPVELRPLRRAQQAGTCWARPIHQPCDAVHIVAVHPVPQGLSLHPGALRRRRARLAIQDGRDRKTAMGLGNTPARPRRTPKILGRQIQACDRKGHRTAPATQQDAQNHAKPSPSFKNESGPAAVGIRRIQQATAELPMAENNEAASDGAVLEGSVPKPPPGRIDPQKSERHARLAGKMSQKLPAIADDVRKRFEDLKKRT